MMNIRSIALGILLTGASLTLFAGTPALAGDAKPADAAAAAPTGPQPDIQVTENAWDFGDKIMGDDTSHVFEIHNKGKAALKIDRAQASCGCTVPSGYDNVVPPGGTTRMTVKYDNSGRPGSFHKVVTVYSNDPDTPQFQLTIKGNIKTEVMVDPMSLYLSEVFRDEPLNAEITVHSDMLDSVKVDKIESNNPAIVATVEPVKDDPKTVKVRVNMTKDVPLGQLNAMLTLHTNGKHKPNIDVPVNATIFGEIFAQPQTINFMPLNPVSPIKQVAVSVKDRKVKGGFEILKVTDTNNIVEATISAVKPGEEYTIQAKVKDSYTQPGHFSGVLEVITNRKGEEKLNIIYNGFIAQAPPPQADATKK